MSPAKIAGFVMNLRYCHGGDDILPECLAAQWCEVDLDLMHSFCLVFNNTPAGGMHFIAEVVLFSANS